MSHGLCQQITRSHWHIIRQLATIIAIGFVKAHDRPCVHKCVNEELIIRPTRNEIRDKSNTLILKKKNDAARQTK